MKWFSLTKIIYHQNSNLSISCSKHQKDLHGAKCSSDTTVRVLHWMPSCLRNPGVHRILWLC